MKYDAIIIVDMQTEYCLDVTCKVAFEYEYTVTIPQGTTTIFDNALTSGKELSEYYENMVWNNRYANVISMNNLLEEII